MDLEKVFKECGYNVIPKERRSEHLYDYNDMMLFAKAINKKCNMHFVTKQSEPLRFLIDKFQTPKGNYLIELLMEREKDQKP